MTLKICFFLGLKCARVGGDPPKTLTLTLTLTFLCLWPCSSPWHWPEIWPHSANDPDPDPNIDLEFTSLVLWPWTWFWNWLWYCPHSAYEPDPDIFTEGMHRIKTLNLFYAQSKYVFNTIKFCLLCVLVCWGLFSTLDSIYISIPGPITILQCYYIYTLYY